MSRKKYNTGKIRTFLLFLALACVIWILTKFSKEYTATISANVFYKDIPENAVLSDSNVKELNFEVTANGFTFLQYQFNKPELNLSLINYEPDENENIVLAENDLGRLVNDELGSDVNITNLSPSELVISFDRLATKVIPVEANVQLQFREGYKSIRGIKLIPDSINISAPEDLIEEITAISTEELSLTDVHESLNRDLQLVAPEFDGVKVNPSEINMILEVTEFTQKTLSIPVTILNLPEDTTVKIIPEQINVSFDVAMEKFNEISAADFSLICDYNERNSEDNFMIVSIQKQPEAILNTELEEKKVDYLIFK
ncbi:YbbR-like domain-containing protein [Aureitalea sp. L0-47]|uniref:CdaR family protein n=1 Tax=Aureitalea sp. L0-47 TaxID=2816962 RepID=UPI002237AB9C|nr:YbbR-like domain-containing protein [Aureitalea sp. L0-47]MCW5519639.1 YbbR-like domain-containing protein [Aureitalea sp. L0-47]